VSTTKKFVLAADGSNAQEIAEGILSPVKKAAFRAILSTAIRVVQQIVTTWIPMQKRQPVDRGAYRAGWRAKKDPEGAIIMNTVPYSGIIEDGARAENIKISRAMIAALAAWVLRKGLVKKGKGKAGKATAQKEAESAAWAIATSMKKKGIFGPKGLQVLNSALAGVEYFFEQELERELNRL
jgi:hypothetical protein